MTKQRIQELLHQQEEAQHSVNKESYYYTETISTNHTVTRFNQGRYDQDMATANVRINDLETQINSLRQQEAAEEQARQQAVAVEQARQRAIAEEKARLEAIEREEIKALTIELNQVQGKIDTEKSVASTFAVKQQEAANRCTQTQLVNKEIANRLSGQEKAIFEKLQSADGKQRAFFLFELWGKPDSETMISIIKSLGVDADELAYYAIKKTHNELFELALYYGANCCNYSVEGKTLLQQLVHNGNESFIKKVLATGQDLASTVVEAIGQNDIVTISKLSSYDSSLLSQKFAGYTLLQIAISAQKTEIVQKILQLGSSSAEVLTNNGESALKIAVRSGNDEIIKMVAQHANLQIEIAQLGSKVDQVFKAMILEHQDIATVIKLLKGEEISLQQYLIVQRSKDEEKIAAEQARKAQEDRLVEETYLEQVQDIERYQEDTTLVTLQGLVLDNPLH
ncbi:ankyrin repeat domain-containing protein [Candidatus Tisiphia endosymbiont of Myopa tessellatipennis]|uniref:ankyrin repeat domain-containing protein n=1 Tax=Candidatus Tisiphia endosymbiont of Myopa tessellatipennis TaxID=3066257 RepID=UPI00313CA1AF